MDAKCFRTKVVKFAPKFHPCPHCGKRGRRKGLVASRFVVDIDPNGGVCRVELRLGEYRATCCCCKTFRSTPRPDILDIEPRAVYSNRVRDLVVNRLIGDNLSVARLQISLQRDYGLELSEGYVYDCLNWKVGHVDMAEYRAMTKEHFSGVLDVDELHLGHRTLLMATDPISDLVISFALVSSNDQKHMRAFLSNLKAHGFEPKLVVTDGSPLYPAVLAELWPEAKHQLCTFHLIKEINVDILDALRRMRRAAYPKARSKKGKRGRPTKAKAKANKRKKKMDERSKFIWDHRYLIVTAPENMTDEDRATLATMIRYLPGLRLLRDFALDVRAALDSKNTHGRAWWLFRKLHRNKKYQADPDLSRALKKLRQEKFAKAIEYLRWTHRTKVRTNNHVERMNRTIRLKEKVRYGWRRRQTLVRFIVLSLDAIRRAKNQEPETPQKRIKRRQKSKINA